MTGPARYYVTTPIYYVNAAPHIGTAYTSIACDMLARFMRLDGRETRFLTGTDEHGQKVQKAAWARGEDTQAYCDRMQEEFREMGALLDIANDHFIRTTDAAHRWCVQAFWKALAAAGQIYKDSYAGWYAVRDEAYYSESELTRDESGRMIAPSGAECEWVEEESWFFRLSDWQQPLLDLYDANPDFVAPKSRMNEVRSFVAGGLRDLSISRSSVDWGVPVPGDPDHVMYVWIDALTNYITYLDYPDSSPGGAMDRFWPADLHMVGKDILRFHAVYWPAFLMAAGIAPPRRIFAHGWLTVEGRKMSKSLGNVIYPRDLVDSYGVDQARYVLMRSVPFGNDGDFSHDAALSRINTDLANDLGNLAQRSLSMIHKNCSAAVPEPGTLTTADRALLDRAAGVLAPVRDHMESQAFHKALEAIWDVASEANRYIDHQAPWALRKTDPARMATVLYVLAETVRHLAILVQPVVPRGAAHLLDQLAVPAERRDFAWLGEAGRLVPGTELPKPEGVFPRLEPAAREHSA